MRLNGLRRNVLALSFLLSTALSANVQHAPVAFVKNYGQAPASIRYQSSTLGYKLDITAQGATIRLGKDSATLSFPGAQTPAIVAAKPLAAKFHFYRGRSERQENLPMFGEVRQNNLYPGIDAVYYGSQSNMEYDMVVHPHADPSRIRFRFDGASKVALQPNGSLCVEVNGKCWDHKAPLAFQHIHGQDRKVEVRYNVSASGEVTFVLGPYDRSQELTIDPVLSVFGNTASAGLSSSLNIAIDSQNNVYAADGADFTESAINVAKFSPAGALIYQFHSAGSDPKLKVTMSIAVAPDGSLAAGGFTESDDLPTNSNSYQQNRADHVCILVTSCIVRGKLEPVELDGFVVKLRPDGTLHWASYLGGRDRDQLRGVAFGPGGTVYAVGDTESGLFPTVHQFQGCSSFGTNAFFSVFNASGTDLTYSTCLHPNLEIAGRTSVARAVTVDTTGAAYVGGEVTAGSGDFEVRGGGRLAPFQSTAGGATDGFAAKFNPALRGDDSLIYSTFLGGNADDSVDALVLDSGNQLCAAGKTASVNYPTRAPAGSNTPIQGFRGPADLVVTCLSANADALAFSNLYGVQVSDPIFELREFSRVRSIARDPQGGLHVVSFISGTFPTVNPFDNAAGRGVYLKLAPTTRAVTILSHTPENAAKVVTDSAGVAFIGTNDEIRKFADSCSGDISSSVQVIQGTVVFDIATNRFRQNVSVRSLIPTAIGAGARLVFSGLPAGVNVVNPSGTTTCFPPAGSQFVTLPIIPPSNAGFATIALEYTSTGGGVFYTPRIAAPGNGI